MIAGIAVAPHRRMLMQSSAFHNAECVCSFASREALRLGDRQSRVLDMAGAARFPLQHRSAERLYSPWTKFCLNNDPNAKQVCLTGRDARIESGMPVVAAVLIEPEAEPKKLLRVTLPLGMQLVYGTRVIIDQNQTMMARYQICFTNGCMADYDASTDLIAKMEKGQGLVIQGINSTGQPISLVLPLADFGKAYNSPPTDPKVFEEQQKKLQEELQHRASFAPFTNKHCRRCRDR